MATTSSGARQPIGQSGKLDFPLCSMDAMSEPFLQSLLALLESHNPNTALQVLQKHTVLKKTFAANREWASLLAKLPDWFLSSLGADVYGEVLFRARDPKTLGRFLQSLVRPSPSLRLYGVWVGLRENQPQRALDELVLIEPDIPERLQGLWWRLRGEALSMLGDRAWVECFAHARSLAQGEDLGHCLMQLANAYYDGGQRHEAIGLWSEAIVYFAHDPYYQAWLHHNIGFCWMRENPTLAERHFVQAEIQARRKAGQEFLPRVLCSLGAIRRILGEWPRAIFNYSEATAIAKEPDDLQQAWWGLGHTYRLSRNHLEALGCFQQALQLPSRDDWLHVEVAATHLMLGNRSSCQSALAKVRHTSARGRTVEAIVRAELARLEGNTDEIEKALAHVEWNTIWVREERGCFPQLFGLFERAYQKHVEPLAYAKGLFIEVRAAGIVHVFVNGRALAIKSNSRMIETLLILLESGNECTNDYLAALLYKDKPIPRSKQLQAVWSNIKELRAALGWKESVLSQNGYYCLDPNATWVYDMHDPTTRAKARFAEGIYSEWVIEVREGLLEGDE